VDNTSDSEVENGSVNSEPYAKEACSDTSYKDSTITIAASNVLIMKYATKHNLTMNALADLLHLLHCTVHHPTKYPQLSFILKNNLKGE